MDKEACGNCGSRTGCGCSTPNPYADGVQVVWHDPTTYDVAKHGPAFLPKLGSVQKAEVRALVKQAAYYDTGPTQQQGTTPTPLSGLLTILKGLALVHQTHHWQTSGTAFYADHLLFERLYNESLDLIDQVAERAVGVDGPDVVDPFLLATGVLMVVSHVCGYVQGDPQPTSLEVVTPDMMVHRSLRGEVTLLKAVGKTLEDLRTRGTLTPGTSNLLEGVADKHEAFVYLLKQRDAGHSHYSYERS